MPRLSLVLRRAIPGAVLCLAILGAVLGAAADPLAQLAAGWQGPSRMLLAAAGESWRLPDYFWDGEQTAATAISWCRFEAPPADGPFRPDLMIFFSHTAVAARATLEGGDTLPAFLDVPTVPLSSGGTWGASSVVPQDAPTQHVGLNGDRFVVCVNLDCDAPATLTVAGEEITTAGPTNMTRNVECSRGDASVALATLPGATARLALAINPWIEFFQGVRVASDTYGDVSAGVTNCWVMVVQRMEATPAGLATRVDCISRDGDLGEYSRLVDGVRGTPRRDARSMCNVASMYGSRLPGGAMRRVELYGWKAWRRAISDAEMWRIWELDMAELRRRGLDTALWAEGERP